MKYIFLALALLIPNSLCHASNFGSELKYLIGLFAAGAMVTAIAVNTYHTFVPSPEKQFEKAEKTLKEFAKDSQIQKALQAEDICDIESWYQLKKVRDLLYHIRSIEIIQKSAPFLNFHAVIYDESRWDEELDDVLVYHYLQGWIMSLQEVQNILQQVCKSKNKDLVLSAQAYEQAIEGYLNTLIKQLELLKAGSQIQKNIEEFESTQKIKQYHYYPAPQPAFNFKPVAAPAPSVTLPAPTTDNAVSSTAPNAAAPSTISPILNGNVYGTIWSNY